MEQDLLSAMEPILAILEREGIRYQIGGSVASSMYGVARSTVDVDMLAELLPQHIDAWVDGIEDAYYVSRKRVEDAVERQGSFNVIHLDTMIKIDVFVSATDPYDQECLRRGKAETLTDSPHRSVVVASPEDVVLHKLKWYRKGGETSERQWLDVLGVLKVQADRLDRDYMRSWARRLGVEDLLERAVREAGPRG